MAKKVFIGDKVASPINTAGTTVGTAVVALSADARKLSGGVQIVADADNTGIIFVGVRPTLTAGTANTTDGFPLSAGESLFLPVQNESAIYCISDAASQTVHFVSF